MNIFVLDENPVQAARLNLNSHVVKIPTEICQVLANCFTKKRLSKKDCPRTKLGKVRKHSYYNHPISKWLRESLGNIQWTIEHGLALCDEYAFRYNKNHFSRKFIEWVSENLNDLDVKTVNTYNQDLTEHPQCFKNYQHLICPGDPVKGYKNYYRAAKSHLKAYKNRPIPKWFK